MDGLTLIIDTSTCFLGREDTAINGEGLMHLQALLAMNNLVGVIRRHTRKRTLALGTFLEEIDIVIIALEQENKRIGRKRSKVLV